MKKIPKFSSEDEEREFWSKADSTKHIDWKKSKKIKYPSHLSFGNLVYPFLIGIVVGILIGMMLTRLVR